MTIKIFKNNVPHRVLNQFGFYLVMFVEYYNFLKQVAYITFQLFLMSLCFLF